MDEIELESLDEIERGFKSSLLVYPLALKHCLVANMKSRLCFALKLPLASSQFC